MPKRPMMPLTLSAYTLVTANGCSRIDGRTAVYGYCCGEWELRNV